MNHLYATCDPRFCFVGSDGNEWHLDGIGGEYVLSSDGECIYHHESGKKVENISLDNYIEQGGLNV